MDPRIEPNPVPPETEPLDPSKDANPHGKRDAQPTGGLNRPERRGMSTALVFLGLAVLVLIGVFALGTWKMPQSGNEPQPTDAVGPPVSSE